MNQFSCLRTPKIYNLRMDPYERGDIGPTNSYYGWETDNVYLIFEGARARANSCRHSSTIRPARSRRPSRSTRRSPS